MDDAANKAILLCRGASIGYTGLAKIGTRAMDDWIVDVLAESHCMSTHHALQALGSRATVAFSESGHSQHLLRHAFVAVTWGRSKGHIVPAVVSMSNALDSEWRWKDAASGIFQARFLIGLPERCSFRVMPIGAHVSSQLLTELRRGIGRAIGDRKPPAAIEQLLVSCIRSVANRNPTVGSNLMAVCIPRVAVDAHDPVVLSSPASRSVRTFWHYGPSSASTVQPGPELVCGGRSMRGFQGTTEPGLPSNQGASARFCSHGAKEEALVEEGIRRRYDLARSVLAADPKDACEQLRRIVLRLSHRPVSGFVREALVRSHFDIGSALVALHDIDGAVRHFEWVAHELRDATASAPLLFWMMAVNNVGVAHFNRGAFDAALPLLESVLNRFDCLYSQRNHPLSNTDEHWAGFLNQVTKSLRNKALILADSGDEPAAKRTQRALSAFCQLHGYTGAADRIEYLRVAIGEERA